MVLPRVVILYIAIMRQLGNAAIVLSDAVKEVPIRRLRKDVRHLLPRNGRFISHRNVLNARKDRQLFPGKHPVHHVTKDLHRQRSQGANPPEAQVRLLLQEAAAGVVNLYQ